MFLKNIIIIPPDTFITPKELLNIKPAQAFMRKSWKKKSLFLGYIVVNWRRKKNEKEIYSIFCVCKHMY
jgi:hypothetical protein